MDARQFDKFTKGLAPGASRRRLLTGLAGGVVADAFAALGRRPSGARADNHACAPFCRHVPAGRQRGQCVSDCATGTSGLYDQCGGDPDRLCIGPDGTAVCCAAGQTCSDGACDGECPAGYEPVFLDEPGSTCLPICAEGTTRCNEACLPFCELDAPHAGACAECVCPPGSLNCTLGGIGYDRPDVCCASDQECCRVGPIGDPSTTLVCCEPGACLPGSGCQ